MEGTMTAQKRNYGIDLLRMASMLMICYLHVINQGGLIHSVAHNSINYHLIYAIFVTSYCAPNCYALISGYVGINSKYKISNILYLWLQVAFYSFTIAVIFIIIKPDKYSWRSLYFYCFPVMYNHYWYFTAYFGLFFFMPILNYAINNMPKKQLKFSLVVLITLITVCSRFNENLFTLESGYSLLWLMVLYLVGGYIKKYEPFKNVKVVWLVLLAMLFIFIAWPVKFVLTHTKLGALGDAMRFYGLISYLSPTVFLVSVIFLELFSRITFKKKPAIIVFFAPISFGVYIIHSHPMIWDEIMKDAFVKFAAYNPVLLVLIVLGAGLAIYIVCALIDYLRLLLFKLLRIKKILGKVDDKINLPQSK